MEIEKKFILSHIPKEISLQQGEKISQGYIFTEPLEMRIRKKANQYYITFKGPGDLSREEWEREIEKWIFDAFWPMTENSRLSKTRFTLHIKDQKIEIDIFNDNLDGLIIMECEFPDENTAFKFQLPSWAQNAVNITNDERYKNKNLARFGSPQK